MKNIFILSLLLICLCSCSLVTQSSVDKCNLNLEIDLNITDQDILQDLKGSYTIEIDTDIKGDILNYRFPENTPLWIAQLLTVELSEIDFSKYQCESGKFNVDYKINL